MSMILTLGLLLFLNFFLLFYLYIQKKQIKSLKNSSFFTKENNIIKSILDSINKSSKSELKLKSSSLSIITSLKNYYKIDYISILILDKKLNIIATNVEKKYVEAVGDHCNRMLLELEGEAKIIYSDVFLDYNSADQRLIKYNYFIPMRNKDTIMGAILIENLQDYKENKFEIEFFDIVIRNIQIAVQNCLYHDEIVNIAMRDNLTRLYNRNYFMKFISSNISQNTDFSLSIFDIDLFKKVNDNYGHNFGDKVLKELSKIVKDSIRECDEVFRWGGEEFIIYLHNMKKEEAENLINNVRLKICENAYITEDGKEVNITASFGISNFSEDTKDIDALINCADKALYESKKNGRNQVTLYRI